MAMVIWAQKRFSLPGITQGQCWGAGAVEPGILERAGASKKI